MKALKTGRLVGTPTTRDDYDAFRLLHADPAVMATLAPDGKPFAEVRTRATMDAVMAQKEAHGFGLWSWWLEDGQFVGYCGLKCTAVEDVDEVELLYATRSVYWRHGYTTEAALAVLDVAPSFGLHDLVAFTLHGNAGSQGVMRKCGFTYERDIVHAGVPHVLFRRRFS